MLPQNLAIKRPLMILKSTPSRSVITRCNHMNKPYIASTNVNYSSKYQPTPTTRQNRNKGTGRG